MEEIIDLYLSILEKYNQNLERPYLDFYADTLERIESFLSSQGYQVNLYYFNHKVAKCDVLKPKTYYFNEEGLLCDTNNS